MRVRVNGIKDLPGKKSETSVFFVTVNSNKLGMDVGLINRFKDVTDDAISDLLDIDTLEELLYFNSGDISDVDDAEILYVHEIGSHKFSGRFHVHFYIELHHRANIGMLDEPLRQYFRIAWGDFGVLNPHVKVIPTGTSIRAIENYMDKSEYTVFRGLD